MVYKIVQKVDVVGGLGSAAYTDSEGEDNNDAATPSSDTSDSENYGQWC